MEGILAFIEATQPSLLQFFGILAWTNLTPNCLYSTPMEVMDGIYRLISNLERVVIGKPAVVRTAVITLLAEGHLLIEDVPGVAKTVLAKSIAASLGMTFSRIQGTPDLLPSDVTGVSVFNMKSQSFDFLEGPVFSNLVLIDELNRATPRTQSALLECMAERQVTVEGMTRPLPQPFLVIATQNPLDFEGTFPLPAAQLDRFTVMTSIGYPAPAAELALVQARRLSDPLGDLRPVWSSEGLLAAQQAVREVRVDEQVAQYIVQITGATRAHGDVLMACSPRASLALYRISQADALINGTPYVVPERVKALAPLILGHRITLTVTARMNGKTPQDILNEILARLSLPASAATAAN